MSKREGATQPLNFVNVSRPARFDPETKKLIRTHVSKDLQRRRRGPEIAVSKICDRKCPPAAKPSTRKKNLRITSKESSFQNTSIHGQLPLSLGSFVTFPITMEPYMHRLINRCKWLRVEIHPRKSHLPTLIPRHDCHIRSKHNSFNLRAKSCSAKLAPISNVRCSLIPVRLISTRLFCFVL